MALEPRIVFDAAIAATADAATDQIADQQAADAAFGDASSAGKDDGPSVSLQNLATAVALDASSERREIVFIDSSVEDLDILMQSIPSTAEVIVLDANRDGVEQIADSLSDRRDIDAIHILSHGESGEIALGNAVLNATSSAAEHADELAVIQSALSSDADLLIYGCNFGSDVAILELLAEATGADVAASTDDTGTITRGGDWDLEASVGAIETTGLAAANWQGILDLTIDAAPDDAAVQDIFTDSFVGDGISATNVGQIGVSGQFGTFTNDADGLGQSVLPLADGLVIVTGDVNTAASTAGNTTDNDGFGGGISTSLAGATGDADLTTFSGAITSDAGGFVFDFQAATDRIAFVFSFASDEYPEFVGTPFNDAFAFLIQGGTEYTSQTNLALIPGTSQGIAVNTLNSGQPGSLEPSFSTPFSNGNGAFYISNSTIGPNAVGTTDPYLEYDGLSVALQVEADLTRNTPYAMKIAIADSGDANWDSAVFFKSEGFLALTSATDNNYSVSTQATIGGNIITDDSGDDADVTPNGDQIGIEITKINGTTVTNGETVTLPSGATLTINTDGSFDYDPTTSTTLQNLAHGTSTQDSFTYEIKDSINVTDTATVTLDVSAPPNADPEATDDGPVVVAPTVAENILVLNNDSDPNTDPLTVTEIIDPANPGTPLPISVGNPATLSNGIKIDLQTNGSIDVTVPFGLNPTETFDYVIEDPDGASDTATVTLTIPTPDAVTDPVTTNEDTPVTIDPLGNDEDGSGAQSVTIDTIPAAAEGILTYTDAGSNTVVVGPGTIIPAGQANTLTFTPKANYNGTVPVINYTLTDTNGSTSQSTIDITVTPVNDAPNALDDIEITDEDTVITDSVLLDNGNGADSDIDSTSLTVTQVNGSAANVGAQIELPSGALLTMNADGTYDYDPNGQFDSVPLAQTDTDSFTYQVDDGNGGVDTATVNITVNGTNKTPVPGDPGNPGTPLNPADDQDYIPGQTGADGTPAADFNLKPYFTDIDTGDTLTLSIPAAELPGGLTFDPLTGAISGTPNADASQGGDDPVNAPGVYILPVTATDNDGATFTTNVTYTITNPAPVAENDTLIANEDNTITGSLFTNNGNEPDNDPDGDTIVVSEVAGNASGVGQSVAGSNGGTFTILADGSYTFDPGNDFQGLDINEDRTTTVSYQIWDGEGGFDTATVTVTVDGLNDAPVPIDPSDPGNPPSDPDAVIPAQTGEDSSPLTPLDITQYFSDVDGELNLFGFGNDAPAWLSINPLTGLVTGAPPANASQGGEDPLAAPGVYTFTVQATDPDGAVGATTVTLTITNPPPVAQDDTMTTDENNVIAGSVYPDNGGSGADYDPDGDTFVVSLVNGTASNLNSPTSGSTGGLFTINTDGTHTFDPNEEFEDLAAGETRNTTITYTIDDGEGGTDQATVTVEVTGVNDTPVPGDPANPGQPLNPADDQNYVPSQTGEDGAPATNLDLTPYFTDPDTSNIVTLSIPSVELPPGLTFDPLTGTISGTPDANASQGGDDPVNAPGIYIIPVTATDNHGASFTTNVTYAITNPPPVAENDDLTIDEDNTLSGSIFADNGGNGADADPDGDTFVVSELNGVVANIGQPVAGSNGGTFTINSDGTYDFDPGLAFQDLDTGEDRTTTITYQVSDGEGGFDDAIVTVTVTGVNDVPVVIDPNDPRNDPNDPAYQPNDPVTPADPDNIIPDQTGDDSTPLVPLDASVYFGDVDGEPLTFGFDPFDPDVPTWLGINPVTGIITGTPPFDASQGGPNNDGVYPVTITATDPDGTIVATTVDFTITNPPPVAQNDDLTVNEDTVLTGDVFLDNGNGTDIDPDGNTIMVSQVDGSAVNIGQPSSGTNGGTFTINDDGTHTFDPGLDFQDLDTGEDRTTTIAYQITDGEGGFDDAFVTITVTGVNDAPVVIDPSDPRNDPNDPAYQPNEPVAPADPDNIIPDQTGDDSSPLTPLDVSTVFTDVDGEPLTFGLDPLDPDVPAWLNIDPATGVITGTPPSDASQGGSNGDGV